MKTWHVVAVFVALFVALGLVLVKNADSTTIVSIRDGRICVSERDFWGRVTEELCK